MMSARVCIRRPSTAWQSVWRSYTTTTRCQFPVAKPKSRKPWPEAQIMEACKSDQISVAAPAVVAFLEDFVGLKNEQRRQAAFVNHLLTKHGLQPRNLSQLGFFFNRIHSKQSPSHVIEAALYRAGAELEDEDSALAIADKAVMTKKPDHPDLAAAAYALRALSDNGSLAVKERLAAVLELQGDHRKAREQAGNVLSAWKSAPQGDQMSSTPPQVRAWQIAAKSAQDMDELREALDAGARDYDDPNAYNQLAALPETSSEDSIKYLLRAAALGNGEAAYGLGKVILDGALGKLDGDQSRKALALLFGLRNADTKLPRRSALALAGEWFRVALNSAPIGDHTSRENAARGVIAAMLELGDYRACQDLLAEFAGSEWAQRIKLAEPALQEA